MFSLLRGLLLSSSVRCWKIFSGEDFQPVGESSFVMLAFVAFNCSLFTDSNHCFADDEQTCQLSVMNKRRQCRASIANPFLTFGPWSHIGWRQYAVATLLLGNCVRRNRCDGERDLWPKQDHASISYVERVDVRCARDKSVNFPRWAYIKTQNFKIWLSILWRHFPAKKR